MALAIIYQLLLSVFFVSQASLAAGDTVPGAASSAGSPEVVVPSGTEKPVPLQPIRLPGYGPEPIQHDSAKTLNLNQVYLSRTVEMNSFAALRQETAVDQEITLRDAINYVLDQGMQIKVSRESMNYQHYLTLAGLAGFLPSFSMQYNLSHANVFNEAT